MNLRKTIYVDKLREQDKKYQAKKRLLNPENKRIDRRKYDKKYPERKSAYNKLCIAIKRGEIIKKPCRDCDLINVQGHHPDYSKPLEVIWLCPSHHKLEDLKVKV